MQNPLQHAVFRAFCSKKWATELRNKLKEFLEFNMPKNSSPQLFHWYANFKKKEIGGGLDKSTADAEDLQWSELQARAPVPMVHQRGQRGGHPSCPAVQFKSRDSVEFTAFLQHARAVFELAAAP